MEALVPCLYLERVIMGNFSDALSAMVGKDAVGLSLATIIGLKSIWSKELETSARVQKAK